MVNSLNLCVLSLFCSISNDGLAGTKNSEDIVFWSLLLLMRGVLSIYCHFLIGYLSFIFDSF